MIDIDWLDTQLDRALTEDLAGLAKPRLAHDHAQAASVAAPRRVPTTGAAPSAAAGAPAVVPAAAPPPHVTKVAPVEPPPLPPPAAPPLRAPSTRPQKRTVPRSAAVPHTPFGHDWDESGFRAVLDSHDDDERYDFLDRCRHRAYVDDDLMWRAGLTVLLARMGRTDEASRELDTTISRRRALLARSAGRRGPECLDAATASAIEEKVREAAGVLASRRPIPA